MWKLQFTAKRWYPSAKLCGVTSLKAVIVRQESRVCLMIAFLFSIILSSSCRSHSKTEISSIPDKWFVLVNVGLACNRSYCAELMTPELILATYWRSEGETSCGIGYYAKEMWFALYRGLRKNSHGCCWQLFSKLATLCLLLCSHPAVSCRKRNVTWLPLPAFVWIRWVYNAFKT
jgi:hypothetical protein